MTKHKIKLTLLALAALALVACGKAENGSSSSSTATQQVQTVAPVLISGRTMGTTYHLNVFAKELKISPEKAKAEIDKLLVGLNKDVSLYIPTSNITKFNALDKVDVPFPITKDFAESVRVALDVFHITKGALNITVEPLVKLWGFSYVGKQDFPTPAAVKEALKAVNINYIELTYDAKAKQHYLTKKVNPKVTVDLNSTAKGYGVDLVAKYLESIGAKNYLAEIGGELIVKGSNGKDKYWNIAIEQPEYVLDTSVSSVIAVKDQAVATSGDYRNYIVKDDVRYSHEINPNTGYPITHNLASLTVIADTTVFADSLATGLYVLGAEKALEIAEKNNYKILLIVKNGDKYEQKASSAFKAYVESTK